MCSCILRAPAAFCWNFARINPKEPEEIARIAKIAKIEDWLFQADNRQFWQSWQSWQFPLIFLLGIDTSGKSGGVTLAEGDGESFHPLASAPVAGGMFSAQLVPAVASLLSANGITIKDLGGLAAASGPGSFTGLRVGLGAVKGLAEVSGLPIVAVSVLQVVAAEFLCSPNRHPGMPICRAVLDASRNQVFLGEYEALPDSAPKMLAESLLSLSALAGRVRDWGHSANLVTPDAALVDALSLAVQSSSSLPLSISLVPRPTSKEIARVGLAKLLAGETVSAQDLDANYIRRSDAEIFSGPGSGQRKTRSEP